MWFFFFQEFVVEQGLHMYVNGTIHEGEQKSRDVLNVLTCVVMLLLSACTVKVKKRVVFVPFHPV